MAIRQRAIQAEHKQERHDAILDAALRLLLRAPDRVVNVADVAREAGLAKGTVYLYFPGKEELLLALHERNMHAFFVALTSLVEGPGPIALDDMIALTHEHLVDPPRRADAGLALLRHDGAERSRADRQCVPAADVGPAAPGRRGSRTPFSESSARRGAAAAAPQLRADHRPVADVGGRGDGVRGGSPNRASPHLPGATRTNWNVPSARSGAVRSEARSRIRDSAAERSDESCGGIPDCGDRARGRRRLHQAGQRRPSRCGRSSSRR